MTIKVVFWSIRIHSHTFVRMWLSQCCDTGSEFTLATLTPTLFHTTFQGLSWHIDLWGMGCLLGPLWKGGGQRKEFTKTTVYPEGSPLSPMLRLPSPGDLENVKMHLKGKLYSCYLVVFILFYLFVGLSVGMCAVCMQEPMEIRRGWVTGSYKQPNVGAGNGTCIFRKNGKHA